MSFPFGTTVVGLKEVPTKSFIGALEYKIAPLLLSNILSFIRANAYLLTHQLYRKGSIIVSCVHRLKAHLN